MWFQRLFGCCKYRPWNRDILHVNNQLEKIMGLLDDLLAKMDEVKAEVAAADSAVEALFDQVKQLTGDGITQEAADKLNAKLDEVRAAVAKVATDD